MGIANASTSKRGGGNGHPRVGAGAGESSSSSILCVVVACHGIAVAIPVERVLRLVLPDQLEVEETATTTKNKERRRRIVRVDEERFVVVNLGELFGLAPLGDAAVLLKIPHENASVTIALMTGVCLVVDQVRPEMSFPALAFRSRGYAFLGAFNAKTVAGATASSSYGVLIDPTSLLDHAELSMAMRDLQESDGGGGG
jgi:hypothetical protein